MKEMLKNILVKKPSLTKEEATRLKQAVDKLTVESFNEEPGTIVRRARPVDIPTEQWQKSIERRLDMLEEMYRDHLTKYHHSGEK